MAHVIRAITACDFYCSAFFVGRAGLQLRSLAYERFITTTCCAPRPPEATMIKTVRTPNPPPTKELTRNLHRPCHKQNRIPSKRCPR